MQWLKHTKMNDLIIAVYGLLTQYGFTKIKIIKNIYNDYPTPNLEAVKDKTLYAIQCGELERPSKIEDLQKIYPFVIHFFRENGQYAYVMHYPKNYIHLEIEKLNKIIKNQERKLKKR